MESLTPRVLRVSVFALSCLCFLALSCSDGFPPEFPAPDFTVKDVMGGRDISLADHKGSPVLIYFFASW